VRRWSNSNGLSGIHHLGSAPHNGSIPNQEPIMSTSRTPIPASYFGIAVGLLALANAWRVGVRLWHLPADVAVALTSTGLVVWVVLLALYARKWFTHRADAVAELRHPVQSAFVALVSVSSLLASMALIPISRDAALAVFAIAVVAQLALGMWLNGRLWTGGAKAELVTPAVYLPGVAQNFVAATAAAAFGLPQLGMLFFGAGLLFWFAAESIILHRAATLEPLPAPLRPLLGIQLAPPVVGGVSYLALTTGLPDTFAWILLGYGLYQALLLIRLLPWIREQAFVPGYWAFSFGVAALPTLAMRMVERGATGFVADLAVLLFVAANLVFALLIARTLQRLVRGALLPVVATAAPTRA
jgi:tellurite resistance protein